MAVDSGYSDYLKSPALFAVATVAGVTAAFGDNVIDQTMMSPLALEADAQDEADRFSDFMSSPIARDRAIIKGLRSDLVGKLVTLTNSRAGYSSGEAVFVIAAQELEDKAVTQLTVIRRL